MACSGRCLPVVLLSLLLLAIATTAAAGGAWPAMGLGLAERLEGEASKQCWEVVMEIKSCTGEIILFFLNGEAYLGPGCCRAIRVIERSCWAADAMMSVIGFTPDEGDMLKGYCDAGDGDAAGGHSQGPSLPHTAPVLDCAAAAAVPAGRKSLALHH
ncbi:hypothetical protein GUJ93_ZPchr0013g36290 [Zizania palustris]|uniref:Prolamin-like domain-containing protein n=1 Tax=Zizania palustris TaxID=103762 RepID=A0A8J5WWU9_ZIZPA|nr:hypothetical protein GUJ93_ZPchr0013g36290 [Zizania palustris]